MLFVVLRYLPQQSAKAHVACIYRLESTILVLAGFRITQHHHTSDLTSSDVRLLLCFEP